MGLLDYATLDFRVLLRVVPGLQSEGRNCVFCCTCCLKWNQWPEREIRCNLWLKAGHSVSVSETGGGKSSRYSAFSPGLLPVRDLPNWRSTQDSNLHRCAYRCAYSLITPGTKPIHAGKNSGGINFKLMHAGPVFALARIQENIFEGSFPKNSSILEGSQFGANTCRARANTGKYSWRIIYVLVSCQGVQAAAVALFRFASIQKIKSWQKLRKGKGRGTGGRGGRRRRRRRTRGSSICPKIVTLEHLIFGQLSLGTVTSITKIVLELFWVPELAQGI